MKRILGAFIATAIAVGTIPCCSITADARTIRGDLNGDKTLSLRDASLIQRISANYITPTDDQLYSADFDENGKISSLDAYELQQYLCKMSNIVSKHAPNREERVEFIELINADRVARGLAPFEYNDATLAAGTIRSKECIDGYRQTRPDGTDFWTVLGECGLPHKTSPVPWQYIAVEVKDGSTLYNYIKNSVPNTYDILTNSSYTTLCVGCVNNSNDTAQWTILVN